jgi:hypothetical protein
VNGDDSQLPRPEASSPLRSALASLGAIAQGAILPGDDSQLPRPAASLASLGANAPGAILPAGVAQ